MKNAVFFAFLLATVQCVQYKHLQGDPSEFSSFVLPIPQATAEVTTGSYTPILFTDAANPVWSGSASCDSTTQFSFCMLLPIDADTQVKPPGYTVWQSLAQVINDLQGSVSKSEVGLSIDDLFPSTCYTFENTKMGAWQFQITASSSLPKLNIVKSKNGTPILKPSGYIFSTNDSPYVLKSFTTQDLLVGQTVTLTGEVVTTNALLGNSNFVLSLETFVTDPDGEEYTIPMFDDGLHSDGDVNDGTFAGSLQLAEAGSYILETLATGVDPQGNYIERATLNYFSAVKSDLQIGTGATATIVGDIAEITIPFTGSEEGVASYLAYAEVWGTSSTGDQVPVAWVSAISDASSDIQLELDLAWVAKANAVAPFTLKNVRIQDSNIQTVLSAVSELSVTVNGNMPALGLLKTDVITEQMKNGRRPVNLKKTGVTGNSKLFLVHGYCANGNPFTASDFTDFLEFNDPNANRNLDTFANLILDFAESNNVDSYSIVAHSQGGLASLHLATYYWSGLDVATGGRLIQSVGSPYQGTALAGGLAGIGGVFGVGCGSNDGMTKSGAQKWLAGIPADKQDKVYYWTTEGSSTCSSGANFIGLDKPNDGVTSKNFSQLPSGHNMGHKSGWCHTADMSSPSQTTDSTRNQEMNSAAARN